MPRYKDGTAARVGDWVRGTGYNLRGADRKHAVVSGVVIHVRDDADVCNLTIATALPDATPNMRARLVAEYGQADAFERIA